MPEISLATFSDPLGQTSPADALMSANVVLRAAIFADGHRRDIATFMDLCNLIEASVLHERLFCLPTGVPAGIENIPVIKGLIEEGVLWKLEPAGNELLSKAALSVLDYIPDLSARQAKNLLMSVTGREVPHFDIDVVSKVFYRSRIHDTCISAYPHINMASRAWDVDDLQYRFMRTVSYLSYANCLNAPYFPNFSRLAIVNPLLANSVKNVQLNFMQMANKHISNYVKADEERLRLAGRQLDLSIPPLASIVFDHTRKNNSLRDALLKAREDFAPVRERFAKYAALITSDDAELRESLAALDVLESDLSTISQAAPEKSSLRMLEWRPIATFIASAVDAPDQLGSAESWTDLALKLLKMPVAAMQSYIRRRRVQPILDVPEKVRRIKGLASLTADTFSWKPSAQELEGVRLFSQAVTQPTGLPEAPDQGAPADNPDTTSA